MIEILVVGAHEGSAEGMRKELRALLRRARSSVLFDLEVRTSFQNAVPTIFERPHLNIMFITNECNLSHINLWEGCVALAEALKSHANKPLVLFAGHAFNFLTPIFVRHEIRVRDGNIRDAVLDAADAERLVHVE